MGHQTRAVGRNAPCPCGSGKKYKQCHGAASTRMSTRQVWVLTLVGAILVSGLVLAVRSRTDHAGQPAGVWSPEHGHYH